MTNKYLFAIGSGDLKGFIENLEETRKGKKDLKVKMKTKVGNFVEITFEDTGKKGNFKPDGF